MNTKTLMTTSSIVLGLAGVLALFAPNELSTISGSPLKDPLLAQLLGALYLAFAFTNWTAKDSVIGGIYARPTSLGNFAHFTMGTLVLAKLSLAGGANAPIITVLVVYAAFAIIFGWLVFLYDGTANKQKS